MSDLVHYLGSISVTCSVMGIFFYPESDLADSNLYCGQMDSDFPYGGLTVTKTMNKQDFKLDLTENLT